MSAPESEPTTPATEPPAEERAPDAPRASPRGGARRGQARDRRAGRDARARARLPRRRRYLLIEGVPGLAKTLTIKTTAAVLGGSFRRIQFTPDLVPRMPSGPRLPAGPSGVRDRPRPGVLQLPPRRRDQPSAREGAVRPPRGDTGTPGDDRPRHALRAAAVSRDGDAEPDRVGGDVPAPRGAGRPVHAQDPRRLPGAGRRLTVVHRSLEDPVEVRQVLPLTDLSALQRSVKDVYVDPGLVSYAVSLAAATREPDSFGLEGLPSSSPTVRARVGRSRSCRARVRSRSSTDATT